MVLQIIEALHLMNIIGSEKDSLFMVCKKGKVNERSNS